MSLARYNMIWSWALSKEATVSDTNSTAIIKYVRLSEHIHVPSYVAFQRVLFQCRPARFESQFISRMKWSGRNMCPKAVRHGIGFLHGNCQATFLSVEICQKFMVGSKNGTYLQAFSDQGANTGCNGDATLRSVFNFWKDQVCFFAGSHPRMTKARI